MRHLSEMRRLLAKPENIGEARSARGAWFIHTFACFGMELCGERLQWIFFGVHIAFSLPPAA